MRKVVLVVLLLVVFAEVTLRLCGIAPKLSLFATAGPFTRHLTRLWAFQPNYDGRWSGVPFRTNAYGLRGEAVQMPKPPKIYRIVVIGGSVTAGNSVKENDTFVQRLEDDLKGQEKTVEVVNAGVPGYSTRQQIELMQEVGQNLQPDLVLLDFAINDVLENNFNVKNLDTLSEFRANDAMIYLKEADTVGERLQRVVNDTPRYTSLYTAARWAKRGIWRTVFQDKNVDISRWMEDELLKEKPSAHVAESWDSTMKDVLTIRDLARAKNAQFAIVMFPLSHQVSLHPDNNRPQRLMKEFGRSNDIPCIDLLPVFQEHARTEPAEKLFFDADHPTALGHELAAQAITAQLAGRAI